MNNYYLYIGRLSEEKGIINLANAWKKYVVTHSDEWLYICGDGPEKETLVCILLQNSEAAYHDRKLLNGHSGNML